MVDMTGPVWLTCLGEHMDRYRDLIDAMDNEFLKKESNRVEVECPPTDPRWNDRDWRTFRRLIRQEMHRRDLGT